MNNFLFVLYSFILAVLLIETPNKLANFVHHPYIFSLVGFIGLYRYGLWLVHLFRALIYEKIVFKKIRLQADNIPFNEYKPAQLYVLMASFMEDNDILQHSIKSAVQDAQSLNLPVTIFIGTASIHDENVVSQYIEKLQTNNHIKIIFIRQNSPDKRLQLGRALRSMIRHGVNSNDYIVFMDGDSIIAQGCIKKCLSVMHVEPDVAAVTTNEKAVIQNSSFLSNIYNLRFAMRNFHMHSLSLSNMLLCLTGRFSVFRARYIINEDFISRIEQDYVDDWYWDKIKLLTGDDKSTWFTLLKNGAKFLYIPDACIYSVERITINPFKKYINDLKRWSGNMLRSNERALRLGPKQTGFFPWLIILDQRMSMWTAIISPFALVLLFFKDVSLFYVLLIWVLTVKYFQSLVLFYYNKQINWTFPFLHYLNQVLNGFIKIYMLFHLKIQHWNNQNVRDASEFKHEKLQLAFARYLTILYIVIFFLAVNAMSF